MLFCHSRLHPVPPKNSVRLAILTLSGFLLKIRSNKKSIRMSRENAMLITSYSVHPVAWLHMSRAGGGFEEAGCFAIKTIFVQTNRIMLTSNFHSISVQYHLMKITWLLGRVHFTSVEYIHPVWPSFVLTLYQDPCRSRTLSLSP